MVNLWLTLVLGVAALAAAEPSSAQVYTPEGYYPPSAVRPAPYAYRSYRVVPPEDEDYLPPPGFYRDHPGRFAPADRRMDRRALPLPGYDGMSREAAREPAIIPYQDFETRSRTRGEVDPRPPADIGRSRAPEPGGIRPGDNRNPDAAGSDITGSLGSLRGRTSLAALPPDDQPEDVAVEVPSHLRRQIVPFAGKEPAGTIVIDTPNTYLYLVLGNGQAVRYGIGVGREGFTWSGREKITRMAEWPDWHPPKDMIERQPYLPRFMAGGPQNPLGARALYLGNTLYRIHGTNQPSTIGKFVSSGCIRMLNDDVEDLYDRVRIGARVVVIDPKGARGTAASAPR